MATRTFPFIIFIEDNFPIKATFMAIIGFSIEFRIGNIVINVLNHGQNSFDVVGHIRNFRIGNATTSRTFLEF